MKKQKTSKRMIATVLLAVFLLMMVPIPRTAYADDPAPAPTEAAEDSEKKAAEQSDAEDKDKEAEEETALEEAAPAEEPAPEPEAPAAGW